MIDRLAGDLPTPEVGNGPWQDQLKARDPRASAAASVPTATSPRRALGNNTRPARTPFKLINGLLGVLLRRRPPGPRHRLRGRRPPALRDRHRLRGVPCTPCPREQAEARYSSSCGSYYGPRCPQTASRTSWRWRSRCTSEAEPDARFEFGLDALVRGIESMKPASAGNHCSAEVSGRFGRTPSAAAPLDHTRAVELARCRRALPNGRVRQHT